FYSEPANQNTAGHNTGGDLRRPRPRDPDVVCVSGVCEAECCRSLQEEFESAADRVRELVQTAPRDKLLYLYARYKQVRGGGGCSERRGSHKTTFGGAAVSCLYQEEETIREEDKNIFDFCRENNIEQVSRALSAKTADVNTKDEEGRALLHWACDRGHKELVSLLLSNNADINCQVNNQSPSACEFAEIVELLLEAGADPSIKDSEGSLPEEVTESSSISSLLRQYTAPKG
uniref:Acyl-CoA binding domain containing 6 n=1 Tax=Astyanax mexicanus TaxID=7994 RepID=A0A8B9HEM8_ASTMX